MEKKTPAAVGEPMCGHCAHFTARATCSIALTAASNLRGYFQPACREYVPEALVPKAEERTDAPRVRLCIRCGRRQPIESFIKGAKGQTRYCRTCRDCRSEIRIAVAAAKKRNQQTK